MTVGELIIKLKAYDSDAVVHIAFNNEEGPVRDVFDWTSEDQRRKVGRAVAELDIGVRVYVCS